MAKKKRAHHEEHENHERWLVSYADFITLLFAFFVVLYATSNKNETKEKEFEESIRQELRLAAAAGGGAGAGAGSGLGASNVATINNVLNPADVTPARGSGAGELEERVAVQLREKLSDEERKNQITNLGHDAMGVRVSLAATSLFPPGSAKLRQASLQTLDKLAAILKNTANQIIVEGHTDDVPVQGGPFETNWELAAARASQVVRYLVKVHQFNPKRLAAISYADQKPVAPNTTEEGRAQNRRIEFLIVTQE